MTLLIVSLLFAFQAKAQDGSWSLDGSTTWSDDSAWLDGIVAGGIGNTANFTNDITDDAVVFLDSNRTIGNINFADAVTTTPGNWTILDMTGTNTLTLQTTSGTPTINVGAMGAGRVVNMDVSLAGNQGLNKSGNGTLWLNRANTYTGLTTLSGGALHLNSATGNAVLGNILLTGTSARLNHGGSNQIANTSIVEFANGSSPRWRLQGFNETVAGVQSNGGAGIRIIEAAVDNTPDAPATLTLSPGAGDTYTFDGFVRDAWNGPGSVLSIVIDGPGTQVFSGGNNVNYTGSTTINQGVLELSGATFANNSTITVNENGTLRFNLTSNGNRIGLITGEGNVEKTGPNLLGFTTPQAYTGQTIVTQGAIFLNNASGGTIQGDIVFNGGGVRLNFDDQIADTSVLRYTPGVNGRFTMHGFNETIGGLDSGGGTGVHIVESGLDNQNNMPATLTVNAAINETYSFDGFVRDAFNSSGSPLSLVIGGEGTQILTGGNGRVTLSGTTTINQGVLELRGGTALVNSAVEVAAAGILRFNSDSDTLRSGLITGSGSVEVTGSSELTLAGNNSYTGTTTVTDGVLLINGDQSAATGAVSIGAGGTLGGSGIIGGVTTVAGSLNPGNSPGTLTFTSDLSLESTSTTIFDIVSTVDFDVLAGAGGNTIQFADGADIIFDFTGYSASTTDTFALLVDWNDRVALGSLSFTVNNLQAGFSIDTSDFISGGIISVVPEPSTYALMVALFALGAVTLRRKLVRK